LNKSYKNRFIFICILLLIIGSIMIVNNYLGHNEYRSNDTHQNTGTENIQKKNMLDYFSSNILVPILIKTNNTMSNITYNKFIITFNYTVAKEVKRYLPNSTIVFYSNKSRYNFININQILSEYIFKFKYNNLVILYMNKYEKQDTIYVKYYDNTVIKLRFSSQVKKGKDNLIYFIYFKRIKSSKIRVLKVVIAYLDTNEFGSSLSKITSIFDKINFKLIFFKNTYLLTINTSRITYNYNNINVSVNSTNSNNGGYVLPPHQYTLYGYLYSLGGRKIHFSIFVINGSLAKYAPSILIINKPFKFNEGNITLYEISDNCSIIDVSDFMSNKAGWIISAKSQCLFGYIVFIDVKDYTKLELNINDILMNIEIK